MTDLAQYTDQCLRSDAWILKKIVDEKCNQLSKWGIQTHSAFEWLTYTAEELGELAKAIAEFEYRGGAKKEIIKEAVQVATLALTIAEIYEKESL
jgi:NTP pyrophosphatase (non-canonical NTP hydrolase)